MGVRKLRGGRSDICLKFVVQSQVYSLLYERGDSSALQILIFSFMK